MCLIAHLGGSSIAIIILIQESPDPVFSYNCTMNFLFCNYIPCVIDYHGYMHLYYDLP